MVRLTREVRTFNVYTLYNRQKSNDSLFFIDEEENNKPTL